MPGPDRHDQASRDCSGIRPAEASLQRLSDSSFETWYRQREYTRNIREGKPFFNSPSKIQPASRHSPSRFIQCHRRAWYDYFNAPEEDDPPKGIYWFGNRFEEDLVMPYLSDIVADEDTYACNSLWVDYTIETDLGEVRVKGETDPVIVDEDSIPQLLLEIKTKRSVEGLSEPNLHHRAQVHAYLHGLSEKYDIDLEKAAIVYGSRTSLDIEVFEIKFDDEFWNETVLSWAANQTRYRTIGSLPPAAPEHDWECEFCTFKERCGRGDRESIDKGAIGLLPVYQYPRSETVEYLDGHFGAKLTPALAHAYPELAKQYGVYRWSCTSCDSTFHWNEIEIELESMRAPECPECSRDDDRGWLSGPSPSEQSRLYRGDG